jgi:hypothetical protein
MMIVQLTRRKKKKERKEKNSICNLNANISNLKAKDELCGKLEKSYILNYVIPSQR